MKKEQTPRQWAENYVKERYEYKGFGKLRTWLLVKLVEYQKKKQLSKVN